MLSRAHAMLVGLALLLPASASAQRRPIEIGFDAVFSKTSVEGSAISDNDITQLRIPAASFRVGFFLSDLVSLESVLSHQYASSQGESISSFTVGAGVLYHLSSPPDNSTFYIGLGGGLNILDDPGNSDTQFGLAGEAGFKVRVAERLALRFAGAFQRGFESAGRFASNMIGVSAGISFFAQ